MEKYVLLFLDFFGTVVFAMTGAARAKECHLDFFGVIVLGCTVGVGGGMIRDCLIGVKPVSALTNEWYLICCIATSCFIFFKPPKKQKLSPWNFITICYAIGLGVFAAFGAANALENGLTLIGVILSAVVTAAGGGVIRDLMTGGIPVVLRSDFYATAALFGGWLYWELYWEGIHGLAICLIVASFVTGLRLLAVKMQLQLPR